MKRGNQSAKEKTNFTENFAFFCNSFARENAKIFGYFCDILLKSISQKNAKFSRNFTLFLHFLVIFANKLAKYEQRFSHFFAKVFVRWKTLMMPGKMTLAIKTRLKIMASLF